jgi:hypothetical protein
MSEFSDEHIQILCDLAAAAGSMIVSADVVRGPVIDLWLDGLIRSNAITFGQLELYLTEKGWRAVKGISSSAD